MLEVIFRGFLEWVYVLLVEMWSFIASGLLDIMGLDFAYLQTHVPIIPQMSQVILASGWALLLGNLVFQALKSMAAGLGFEGEDPKLLFSRTFVFAFLLLASPQICRIGLDLTSSVMDLLSVPDATDVELVNEGVFGSLTAAWLMAMICSVIVMFKVLGLVIEIAERYVILAMLAITAPLAFAMGGSKNTASIFSGWCRMFGSMCLLMVTNLICFKMLFSVLSTVPSGLDVLPWMVLIFAIVKVAKKSDAVITRIGLNPAITGGSGRTLPGMLAYTVIRSAVSQAVKGAGGGSGASASASAPKSGRASGSTRFNGSRFSPGGGGRFSGSQPSGGETRDKGRDSAQGFNSGTQGGRYSSSTTQQESTRQENPSHGSTQRNSNGATAGSGGQTARGGGRPQQARRSSVPPGGQRPRGYVPPSGAAGAPTSGTAGPGNANPSGDSRSGTAGTALKGGMPHPGQAGTASKAAPKRPNGPQTGAAGTRASRSTHSATQSTGGSTVNNTSQTSTQTTVTTGKGASGPAPKAPPAAPRAPRPGGPAIPTSGAKQGGASQPGGAGKPSRSTQRPVGSAPRPGRNTAPTAAAPPAGRTPPSPARQEHASSLGRTAVSGTSPGPAPQEGRRPSASTPPPVKGGAPSVRPGGAGTASTGKRAAGQPWTANARTARAKPAHRPPPNRRGESGHG